MRSRALVPWLWILTVVPGMPAPDRCFAQGIATGLYLGQTPPGSTPEVFAPGVISLSDRYEYSVAFSPDLTECVFGVTNNLWNVFNLWFTTMDGDSVWSDPVVAPFQGDGDALSPAYSSDGNTVFFASPRPSYPPGNLYLAERDGIGGWNDPVLIPAPVSTAADEWAPCVTAAAALYFVSYRAGGLGEGDLYRSVPVGGVYTTVENVGPVLNSVHLESTPFVAPDESYILFESNRPGGFGQHDIYISYRQDDTWSAPQNLGPEINTSKIEDEPYVTPDGKYLFFNRRNAFVTGIQTDLWWVDIDAVLDPTFAGERVGTSPRAPSLEQNRPNPFHPSTRITYALAESGFVTLRIYDVAGRRVGSLVDRTQPAGSHSVTVPESVTRALASGPYFYRLLVDGKPVSTRKMVLKR